MVRKEIVVDHEMIRDYWKDKLRYRQEIAIRWEDSLQYCWACRGPSPLERSHIIPDCLGGSPDPDNLVLLCYDCNRFRNPETVYSDLFWKWMKERVNLACRDNLMEDSYIEWIRNISRLTETCITTIIRGLPLSENHLVNVIIEYYLLFGYYPWFLIDLAPHFDCFIRFSRSQEMKSFYGTTASTMAIRLHMYAKGIYIEIYKNPLTFREKISFLELLGKKEENKENKQLVKAPIYIKTPKKKISILMDFNGTIIEDKITEDGNSDDEIYWEKISSEMIEGNEDIIRKITEI